MSVHLSSRERVTFERLLEDTVEGGPAPIAAAESLLIYERILGATTADIRIVIRALLFAFEWLPALFGGARFLMRRYTRMKKEEREAYLEAIVSSRVYLRRACLKALTSMVLVSHYGRPSVQRAVGYDAIQLGTHYQRMPGGASS